MYLSRMVAQRDDAFMCGTIAVSVALFCGANISTQKDKSHPQEKIVRKITLYLNIFKIRWRAMKTIKETNLIVEKKLNKNGFKKKINELKNINNLNWISG